MLWAVLLLGTFGFLAYAEPAKAATATRWCARPSLTPHQAIDCVFPRRHRAAAHRIAECESTASAPTRIARARGLGRWARNGQYIGIFQMGTNERASHGRYGLGSPAIVQVRSARSLHRSRGWQPWACA